MVLLVMISMEDLKDYLILSLELLSPVFPDVTHQISCLNTNIWWARLGSNQGPLGCEPSALTTEPRTRAPLFYSNFPLRPSYLTVTVIKFLYGAQV